MKVVADMIANRRNWVAIRICVKAVNTGRAARAGGGELPGGNSRSRRNVLSSESVGSRDPKVEDVQKPAAGSPREIGLRSSPMAAYSVRSPLRFKLSRVKPAVRSCAQRRRLLNRAVLRDNLSCVNNRDDNQRKTPVKQLSTLFARSASEGAVLDAALP
jgi:hypothetical protein